MSSPGFTYRQDANGTSPVKLFRQDVASTQNSHVQLYSDMYARSPPGPQQRRSPPPPAGHGTDSPIAWLDDVEQKLRTVQSSNARGQSPHRPASPLVVGFLKSPSRDTSSRGTPPRETPPQPPRRSPPPRTSPPKSAVYPPHPPEASHNRERIYHGEGIGGGIDSRTRPNVGAPSTTSSRPPSPFGGGGGTAASTRWVDDLELFVASGGDGAKWLAAANDQRSPSRHHGHATATSAAGHRNDSVNARAADVLRHPPSPPPRSSANGGSGHAYQGGQHRPEAVAEATRALEYELRQLDADFTQVRSYGGYGSDSGSHSVPNARSNLAPGLSSSNATAPVFDHGTSRAVAAALGALQRKQQQLNDELAEKKAVVKQLEGSLASATSASRDEDAALHQANLNEQSRSAVQVAVLEGEVERLQREATALKDALSVLEAEDAAAAGAVALAGDRAQLAEERASVQAQKVKEAQQEYDAASAALAHTRQEQAAATGAAQYGANTTPCSSTAAAGSMNAGQALSSSSSSPAVAALEARVAAAEGARDQAAAERSALEEKVVETNRRLDVALSHLEELVKLMGDEKHKGEIAEQLGKVRWRAAWRNNQNGTIHDQHNHSSNGSRQGGGGSQQQQQLLQEEARKAAARDADAAMDATTEARQRWQSQQQPTSFGFGGGGAVNQRDVLLGSAESRFQSAMSAVRDATKAHSSSNAAEPPLASTMSLSASSPAVEAAQRAANAVAAAAQAAEGASSSLGDPYSYHHHQYQDASAVDAAHYAAASVAAAAAAAAASIAAAVTGELKRSSPPLHHYGHHHNHEGREGGGGGGGTSGHQASDEVAADLSTVFHATTHHGDALTGGGAGMMARHHTTASSSWKPSSPNRYNGVSPTSSNTGGGLGGSRAKSPEQLVGMAVSGGSPRGGGGEQQQAQPWNEDDVAVRQEAWGEVLAHQQKQSEQWQATLARQAELSKYWEEQLQKQAAELSSPPQKPKVTRRYRTQQKALRRLATARSASPPGNACCEAESLAAAAWWTGRTRETDALAVAKARNAALEVRRRHEAFSGSSSSKGHLLQREGGGRRSTTAATTSTTATTAPRRRTASSRGKSTRRSTAADEPPSPSRRTSSRALHSSSTSSAGRLRAATARDFKEGAATYVPVKAKKVVRSSDGLRVWHG